MRRAQLTYRATDDPRCRLVTYFVSSISSFIDPRDASARGCRRERRAVHSDFSRLSWRSRWASPRVSPRHGAVTRRARLVMRRATSPPTFASLPAAMRVEPAASPGNAARICLWRSTSLTTRVRRILNTHNYDINGYVWFRRTRVISQDSLTFLDAP